MTDGYCAALLIVAEAHRRLKGSGVGGLRLVRLAAQDGSSLANRCYSRDRRRSRRYQQTSGTYSPRVHALLASRPEVAAARLEYGWPPS